MATHRESILLDTPDAQNVVTGNLTGTTPTCNDKVAICQKADRDGAVTDTAHELETSAKPAMAQALENMAGQSECLGQQYFVTIGGPNGETGHSTAASVVAGASYSSAADRARTAANRDRCEEHTSCDPQTYPADSGAANRDTGSHQLLGELASEDRLPCPRCDAERGLDAPDGCEDWCCPGTWEMCSAYDLPKPDIGIPISPPGLTHPNAFWRRIRSVRLTAPGWDGGIVEHDAPASHRNACDAYGAGITLLCARDELRSIYVPPRGRGVDSMAWWLAAYPDRRLRARRFIRAAAATIEQCERAAGLVG